MVPRNSGGRLTEAIGEKSTHEMGRKKIANVGILHTKKAAGGGGMLASTVPLRRGNNCDNWRLPGVGVGGGQGGGYAHTCLLSLCSCRRPGEDWPR